MDAVTVGLIILITVILAGSLIMTLRTAYWVKKREAVQDAEISTKVREHNLFLNPVFLTYVFAGIVWAGTVIYMVLAYS
ncbi:hypothetical protein [Jeotgalibacillus aurantiacus]|uniref:hypothetical protein n=1 Tax=Jeotgalibacillus aurantiacus TaxID=2763266 RepID=UPI001D0B1847|nr:hypothetical protein [Jeotgalibacillus aurantiacus]